MIDFLNNDIQDKKDFLKELPLKTKRNKVSFNETLEQYANEYNEYKQAYIKEIENEKKNANHIAHSILNRIK